MRDILIKNLTSDDKRRKIIATYEVSEKEGMYSIIRRHFVCVVKEVTDVKTICKPAPYLYVRKEHDSKERKHQFFCKLKGNLFASVAGNIYLIQYAHSLKISLLDLTHTVSL